MRSLSILSGVVCGEYLFITLPLLSIKNLVKFHLIASDPITPLASFFKCLNNGLALDPLTLILSKILKLTLKFISQNSLISSLDPGSCAPN